MTLDESANLSPEQLRVAVAERMGKCQYIGVLRLGSRCGTCNDYYQSEKHDIPDYPNDRDACAEFEARLTGKERAKYVYLLREIHGARVGNLDSLIAANEELAFSNATQRCRAFLAVSGNEL